jgi:ABC-type molybdate transport system substrate-binding protein
VKGKILIIGGFLAVAALIFFTAQRRGPDPAAPAVSGVPTGAPAPAGTPAPVVVTMLTGTEKRDFINEMASAFQKEQPQYRLQISAVGSLEAADRILEGKEKPAVFSPADSLILAMLASDWQTKNGSALFDREGEGAPQPLLITPLVFVAWEDRAETLVKAAKGHISWKTLRTALVAPKGWAAIGGDSEWGFVKLGHTDPTRSNSGLQAVLSMAVEHHGGHKALTVTDLLEPALQGFVRDIEKGVTKFETSTGTFMTDMVRFGPSKYDVAVVYESLAISQIENAQGRWGNLRVYYPTPSFWSDHPIALVDPAHLGAAEKAGALAWIRFLKSRPAQERALSFGFRPADPAVPLKTPDPNNPFQRLASYGLKVTVPPAAPAPEGPVIRNLITMWNRLGLR